MVHPYIPNSVPQVRREMLAAVGAESVEEFYADVPESIRLRRPLDLPEPMRSEPELVRHMAGLLRRNISTSETLSFLGAGCYQHHVPAVCDEVNGRSEFLTAYAGEPYEDHGRFQATWEYTSMMGELLEMDVVNVPTYDGFQASATALRMAGRITGRGKVLVPETIDPDKLARIREYLHGALELTSELDDEVAAVYAEYPGYLGPIDTGLPETVARAHEAGALAVVSVDPIALGVLAPPASFGADIVCGDLQPLGIHMQFGGGHAGFIATADEEHLIAEYPSRLFGIAPTTVPGEYGFGDVSWERTSLAERENGKEWVGTAAALWGITAGVYLALMGPAGMAELGHTVMARTRYAMTKLAAIPGVAVPFAAEPHFKEFVVRYENRSVAEVNAALLERGIFGGKDLSGEFPSAAREPGAGLREADEGGLTKRPQLGQAALLCVTEVHSQADIDRLVSEIEEIA